MHCVLGMESFLTPGCFLVSRHKRFEVLIHGLSKRPQVFIQRLALQRYAAGAHSTTIDFLVLPVRETHYRSMTMEDE